MSYPARAEELGKYDKVVLHIFQNSRTETSSCKTFVWERSYPSEVEQLSYSIVLADRKTFFVSRPRLADLSGDI